MKSCKLRCPKVKLLTRLQEYLLSSDIRIFTGICLAIHYSALINRYSNTINHYKGRVRVWLDHSLAVQRSQTGRIVQPIIAIKERPLTVTLVFFCLVLLLLLLLLLLLFLFLWGLGGCCCCCFRHGIKIITLYNIQGEKDNI